MKKFIKTLLVFAFIMPVMFLFAGCTKTFQIDYMVNGELYKTVYVKSNEPIFRQQGPKYSGYAFDGWYLSETGEEKFDFSKYLNKNVKLYARYHLESYAVVYHNMTDATNNPENKTQFDMTTTTFQLHKDGVTKTGYTFGGWFDEPIYTNERTHINQGTHADVHVYGLWIPNEYTITFDSNGGTPVASITGGYQTGVNPPEAPTKAGFDFAGWYTDNGTFEHRYDFTTIPLDGIALYAKWTPANQTITFNSNGGSDVANLVAPYGSAIQAPSAPTKTGYTFEAWYTDNSTFENQFVFETMPLGGATLYANWTVNQYTITFDSNGGSEVASKTQDYGTAVTAPTSPTKNWYDFAGWYRDAELTQAYTFTTMPAENITLYARWTATPYTITYTNINRPTVTFEGVQMDTESETRTQVFYRDNLLVLKNVREDYRTNLRWRIATSGGSWAYNDYIQIAQNGEASCGYNNFGDVTLELVGDWIEYSINYHLDAEAGETNHENNPATYTYVSDEITLATPTKVVGGVAYTFLGWYSDAEFTGEPITTIAQGSHEEVNLYAKWALMVDNEADFVNAIAISGETVIVTGDISLTNHINFANDITINLGGNTLTFAGDNEYLFKVPANKAVTIINGSIEYTSSVIVNALSSYIENRGNLTLKEVTINLDNIVGVGPDNLNAIGNNGEGVLVIEDSTITMQAEDNVSSAYKVVGLWNMGRTMLFKNSTLNVTTASRNSSYGVYNYINTGEVNPGTRTVTIDSSTINFTATSLISASGIFAESYVEGETNASNIVIIGTTYVNVTRDLESGSGKKTYALRAKGNATITGASNAQLNITDNTDCTEVERGEETGETGTGSITD